MTCNRCSFRYKSWSCLFVCMKGYCIMILYNIVLYHMISYYTKSFFYIYSNTDCLRVCPGSPNAEQKNMWFCRENASLHFSLTKRGSKMCSKLSHISNGKTSWQSERLRRREFYSMFTESTSNATWVTERERGRDISPDIAINAKMHRQKEDMRNPEFLFIFKALVLDKLV